MEDVEDAEDAEVVEAVEDADKCPLSTLPFLEIAYVPSQTLDEYDYYYHFAIEIAQKLGGWVR